MIFIVFFYLVLNTTLEGVHVDFIPGNEKFSKIFKVVKIVIEESRKIGIAIYFLFGRSVDTTSRGECALSSMQ